MILHSNQIITMDDLHDIADFIEEKEGMLLAWDAGPTCYNVREEDSLSSNRKLLKAINTLINKKLRLKKVAEIGGDDVEKAD